MFHLTFADNLPSILANGIHPSVKCGQKGISSDRSCWVWLTDDVPHILKTQMGLELAEKKNAQVLYVSPSVEVYPMYTWCMGYPEILPHEFVTLEISPKHILKAKSFKDFLQEVELTSF